jgi:protein SCO1/2
VPNGVRVVTKQGQSVGKAAIGGPFALVNAANGKTFTDKDLHGQFALLYFGFTHCPDICPDELLKVAEVVDLVGRWVWGLPVVTCMLREPCVSFE